MCQRELFTACNADHLFDEVDARDHFGHGVLDLQARVHFQEVEGAVLAGHEFDRAGRIVVDRLGQRDSLCAHQAPRVFLVKQGRRRLLDDLLIAALDRAFALAEVNNVAVLVAQHLDFDMTRIDDELLDEDPVIAEARGRLRLGKLKALPDLVVIVGKAACPCRRRRPRP